MQSLPKTQPPSAGEVLSAQESGRVFYRLSDWYIHLLLVQFQPLFTLSTYFVLFPSPVPHQFESEGRRFFGTCHPVHIILHVSLFGLSSPLSMTRIRSASITL